MRAYHLLAMLPALERRSEVPCASAIMTARSVVEEFGEQCSPGVRMIAESNLSHSEAGEGKFT